MARHSSENSGPTGASGIVHFHAQPEKDDDKQDAPKDGVDLGKHDAEQGGSADAEHQDKNGFKVIAHGWRVDKNGLPIPQTGPRAVWYELLRKVKKEVSTPPALSSKDRKAYEAMASEEAERARQEAARIAEEARQRAEWEAEQARQEAARQAELERQQADEARHQARLDYREQLIDRLRYLANAGIQPIFTVANIKSATKSATAIGLGTVIAQYTRGMTLLIPSTANTATVTAGQMAGIVGRDVSIDDYLQGIENFGVYRQLSARTPRTKEGLRVIVEAGSSAANEDDANKVVPFVKAIDVTLPNVDALILDLGNDNISKRSIATQAARLAHVVILPFVPDDPITHTTLRKTIDGYNTDEGIPADVWTELFAEFRNVDATGLNIKTRDKINHSILVATKASGKVDFASYVLMEQSASADDLPPWAGTGITVPEEPVWKWKTEDGKLRPFDYSKILLETDISYLMLAVAGYELTGVATGVDIGAPMVANVPKSPTHSEARDA